MQTKRDQHKKYLCSLIYKHFEVDELCVDND